MLAIVQHTPLCVFSLLAMIVLLGVRALRPNVRFEDSDADVIEEIRRMVEADLEAKHLATDARRLSGA
jgi:hypothetical protein